MSLRIRLTGTVGLVDGDTEYVCPARQTRLVLAYLALEGRRPVPLDELADQLWPDQLPAGFQTAVRMAVSRLRCALTLAGLPKTTLRSASGGYGLALPDDVTIDVRDAVRASAKAEEALTHGDATAARSLAESACAVAAYPFLAGESTEWVEQRRHELFELHVRALVALSTACALLRAPADGIVAAERAVALDRFREPAHRALMAAHIAADDVPSAVRAYEACRLLLATELGVDPSPQTRALHASALGPQTRSAARRREPAYAVYRAAVLSAAG